MENEKFQDLVLHQLKVLTDGQKSLENGQLRIESRMENEVIEKIRGLYDDRSVNQDYLTSIRDTVARIEESVEFAHRRISNHEFKINDHDRELRLLRTERK